MGMLTEMITSHVRYGRARIEDVIDVISILRSFVVMKWIIIIKNYGKMIYAIYNYLTQISNYYPLEFTEIF